ncbi:hypothetical protein BHE74_00047041 [Ensete ventricosum]|nr:hypothetical protein BHE74_00047041 [Ensete ventricosum]
MGNHPLWPSRGWCLRPQAPPLQAPAMPAGGRGFWRLHLLVVAPCGLATPTRGFSRGRPPLQVAWPWLAAPARGLDVANHPFSRCVCCKNVARMRRTILRDSISSHAV